MRPVTPSGRETISRLRWLWPSAYVSSTLAEDGSPAPLVGSPAVGVLPAHPTAAAAITRAEKKGRSCIDIIRAYLGRTVAEEGFRSCSNPMTPGAGRSQGDRGL